MNISFLTRSRGKRGVILVALQYVARAWHHDAAAREIQCSRIMKIVYASGPFLLTGGTQMHRFCFSNLILPCSLWFVCATASALDIPKPVPPGQEPWRKPFNAALEKKITADFKKKPFDEMIEFFREQTKVTIVVDPAALTEKPIVNFNAQNIAFGQLLKQALQPLGMEYEVRDQAIFLFHPKKVDKSMLVPEDFLIQRMLNNRAEQLNFDPDAMPAGDALKQLTEPAGIKLAVDPAIAKNPVTLKLSEINLGFAIRWVVRFAGGKIIVDKDGLRAVKR
jgi:hypothetical protein